MAPILTRATTLESKARIAVKRDKVTGGAGNLDKINADSVTAEDALSKVMAILSKAKTTETEFDPGKRPY